MTLPLALRMLFAPFFMWPLLAQSASAPRTERHCLSGHGLKDAVPWEFSVTAGRRADKWSTMPVPSNWEQHGQGNYRNGETPKLTDEPCLYRLRFSVSRRYHAAASVGSWYASASRATAAAQPA